MSIVLEKDSSFTTTTIAAGETASATRFYRAVWRWHFYAGLFVIPFMMMLAITGVIYLFKPQLDALMYRDLMFVPSTGAILLYTQQLKAAHNAYPAAEISTFTPSPSSDRSAEVSLTTADERNLTVFVDPYTGKVLGERDEDNNLQTYAVTLHGELMLGQTGDYLVELAVSWGLVLIVSGLYLWWPRKGSAIWGTLLPRLQLNNKRIFWRDLHAVPGFWGALLLAFMILTGLPWAGFWGDNFAKVSSQYPAQMWDNVPASTVLTGSLNDTATKVVPWAAEHLPMPQSSLPGHENHQGGESETVSQITGVSGIAPGIPVNLDSVVALAQAQGAPAGFGVSLPADETGVYTVSAFPNDPARQITMHIDQYSGQVLADVRWEHYGLVPKTVEMGIALHEGRYFGLANQMLMLFATLLVLGLCVTGTVMWWQRRPAGRLGAPAVPKNLPLWKGAVAIIVVMGLLFPLVGISLIAVLLLDYLVIPRVPALKQALN